MKGLDFCLINHLELIEFITFKLGMEAFNAEVDVS